MMDALCIFQLLLIHVGLPNPPNRIDLRIPVIPQTGIDAHTQNWQMANNDGWPKFDCVSTPVQYAITLVRYYDLI